MTEHEKKNSGTKISIYKQKTSDAYINWKSSEDILFTTTKGSILVRVLPASLKSTLGVFCEPVLNLRDILMEMGSLVSVSVIGLWNNRGQFTVLLFSS